MITSSWKRTGQKITYQVVIPPNSTAELSLKGKTILESGKKLTEDDNIKWRKQENNSTILLLKSGSYIFTIRR